MENRQQLFFLGDSSLGMEKQPLEMMKDLVLRWFLQAQALLLSPDGTFPEWFHGFITRNQTEELLKDKDCGCFLIRLRERALGYILSYRGKDRCRHFVISCQKNGRYIISGDTHSHQSLAELISYYQTSEIEPFGENLTVACLKLENKNVYDEIALEQRSSAKQSSELARQPSGRSTTATSMKKDTISQQLEQSRKKLQEQQRSFSKETKTLSTEASLDDDPDAAPPIPERSRLLMAEEGLRDEASAFPSPKHPTDKRLEGLTDTSQTFAEPPPNLENPGQGNFYCKRISSKPPDKLYSKRTDLIETGNPRTIYSEIGIDQCKGTLTQPESQSNPSLSLIGLKKATLNSPASTPPKLSPKLPSKPKTSTESQGQQQTQPVPYSTSPMNDEGHRMPVASSETSPDLPRKNLYGQVHKLKSQKPTMSVRDDPYKQIPFEWSKRRTPEPKNPPRSSPLKPKEVYEQACMKTAQSSRTQSYTENAYERIPVNLPKSHSTRQAAPADDIYEKISFVPGKGSGAKPSQKSDKPRRFLFADKKTKF